MTTTAQSNPLHSQKTHIRTKKILLLNPGGPGIMMRGLIRERPTQYGFCWPSVDAIITSGVLHASGHKLSYVDASLDKVSVAQLSETIKGDGIEAVISLYSHFSKDNDIGYLKQLKGLNPHLKIVILPDMQFVLNPARAKEFLKSETWLDAIILSITSSDIDRFLSGEQTGDLINMCYKINGEVHLGPKDIIADNDYRIPIPRHELFKNRKYFLPASRDLYITTTTMQFGCPYQCDFCLDKEAYKKSWCRSPQNMIEEMEHIAACGFTEVYFRDLTFGLNRSRTAEFCRLLKERKLPLRFICTTRVDTVDEELLTLMKEAGCSCIEFGIESYKDETLALHKKGTKSRQAEKTFALCRKIGIETVMFMILGFPDETKEDIQKSIQFSFDLKGDFLAPNLANLLPQTDFDNNDLVSRNQESQQNPWENYRFDSQNFSHPTISEQEMNSLLRNAVRQFYLRPSFIVNRLRKMRSFGALRRLFLIGAQVLRSIVIPKK